jgi:diguanylate cyclase (GGDEF)-like protein
MAHGRPIRDHGWLLPVVLPLLLVVVILVADALESPKTAYVGVLTAVPMLSAVFGSPRQVAAVGALTWVAAFGFGRLASDGNVTAQTVRLGFIAAAAVIAVLASVQRARQEALLVEAEREHAVMEQVRREATTDVLTGLLNRRGISQALTDTRRDGPWTLATVDCDAFKQVNDELGHPAGDEYLQTLARRLTRALGPDDLIGRWGGDELLLALPLPPEEGAAVLRRIHEQVVREPVTTASGQAPLRITIGAAEWGIDQTYDHALRHADAALYQGKGSGGSCVVLDSDVALTEPAQPPAASPRVVLP